MALDLGRHLRQPLCQPDRGAFLVGYALALKASEVQIGLLATFPLLANIVQPFSTYLIERIGRRRSLALPGGAFACLLWLVVIGASLYLTARRSLLYLSLWIVTLSQAGTAVNNLAWMSWMADLGCVTPLWASLRCWPRWQAVAFSTCGKTATHVEK